MLTVPPEFRDAAKGTTAVVKTSILIYWDGESGVEEKYRLVSLNINMPGYDIASPDLNPLGSAGVGSLVLANEYLRYSRHATTGDDSIRAYINGDEAYYGKRILISAGYDNASSTDMVVIFTGYIYSCVIDPKTNHATFELRDNGMIATQRRISNELDIQQPVHWLIEKYAGLADLSDVTLDTTPFVVDVSFLEDDSILEECRKLAASVGGCLFFNNEGSLVFHTADNWIRQGVSDGRTFESHHFVTNPGIANPDLLASKVIANYSTRVAGESDILYSLDGVETILPDGGVTELTCRLTNPALVVDPLVEGDNYWFANNSGVVMNEHCTIEFVVTNGMVPSQQIDVVITNTHPTLSATLTSLEITGVPILGGPKSVKKKDTGYTAIERERSMSDNFFNQSEKVSTFLVNLYADRYGKLIDVWTMAAGRAFPWLEIGDHIQFKDNNEYRAYKDGYVVNISYTMRASGHPFSAVYTVVDRETFHPKATTGYRSDYFYIGIDCPNTQTDPPKRSYY